VKLIRTLLVIQSSNVADRYAVISFLF